MLVSGFRSEATAYPQTATPEESGGTHAAGCGFNEAAFPNKPVIVNSSGITEFDSGIELERPLLNEIFRVTPDFAFIDDGSQPRAWTERRDKGQRVLFGKTMAAHEKLSDSQHWQSRVIGILAHEWAHAMQFESGLQELKFIQELHADYLAGWYLGLKRKVVDVSAFANSLYEKGTKITGGFFNPDAYGSPDQRVQIMRQGYSEGTKIKPPVSYSDLIDAANDGYHVVAELSKILQH